MTGGVPLTFDDINASFGRTRDNAHRLRLPEPIKSMTRSSHAASFPTTGAL
jgi:hypothetical protein